MKRFLPLIVAAFVPLAASAIVYRSVESATVLYDAPSLRGAKLFVIKRETPVEIVVSVEGWAKVRDAEGGLAWIESKHLVERRTVIVRVDVAEIRQKADETSPRAFAAEKNVALEYLETLPGGWIKVRHRDGQSGYVRANQVWGG